MFQRLSLFFLFSISLAAAAQQAKPWPAFTQRKVDPTLYPASPVPDRIILSVAADPATSIGVSWRTDTSITSGYAEIKKAAGQPEAQDAQRIPLRRYQPVAGR